MAKAVQQENKALEEKIYIIIYSYIYYIYKAEKPSVCLSIRPYFFGGPYLGHGCMD